MNGGFGLVLDGSADAERRAKAMLEWDVTNGVSRRCWSGNVNAEKQIAVEMAANPSLQVTMPNHADDALLHSVC